MPREKEVGSMTRSCSLLRHHFISALLLNGQIGWSRTARLRLVCPDDGQRRLALVSDGSMEMPRMATFLLKAASRHA